MGLLYKIFIMTMCMGMCLWLQMGFIFILLGLLPSIVAKYTDRTRTKVSFKIVSVCNFGAMIPSIEPMVKAAMHSQRYDASNLLVNPRPWMYAYVGAASGWILIYLSRFLAQFFISMSNEHRATALKKVQEQLIEEWGDEITQTLSSLKRKQDLDEEDEEDEI